MARALNDSSSERPPSVPASLLRIPVIGSIARGDQRQNCSMRGSSLPEFVKDYNSPCVADNGELGAYSVLLLELDMHRGGLLCIVALADCM